MQDLLLAMQARTCAPCRKYAYAHVNEPYMLFLYVMHTASKHFNLLKRLAIFSLYSMVYIVTAKTNICVILPITSNYISRTIMYRYSAVVYKH